MHHELHVLTPTALLPGDALPREAFDRVWRHVRFRSDASAAAWRGCWSVSDAEAGELVLKAQRPARGRGRLQRLDRAFRTLREAQTLRAFEAAGAPVPPLLAWGVERRHRVPQRSFLLLRRLPDARNFEDFLRHEGRRERRERALEAVGAAVARLHARGLFHRALSPRNLLLREDARGFEVAFIDCPRATGSAPAWRRPYLARADRALLARHAARAGADDRELSCLLRASGEPQPAAALDFVRRTPASPSARPALWLWLGR